MKAITSLRCGTMLAGFGGLVPAELTVSSDFEGGSATVDSIDAVRREIHVRPGGDPARGWPCWWFFRIDGVADHEDVTVFVRPSERPARNNGRNTGKPLASNWSLPVRAVVSSDGIRWRQTEPGVRDGDRIAYALDGTGGPLWMAWGPPFTASQQDALREQAVTAAPECVSVFELARSREGRTVQGLRLTATGQRRMPAVWVQARQHAWESGSSWVASGLVAWLLGDEPHAVWLRGHADVFVIPVMDVDRVATGDGGKEAEPHDHNRDWSGAPYYPEVAATQQRLRELAAADRLTFTDYLRFREAAAP